MECLNLSLKINLQQLDSNMITRYLSIRSRTYLSFLSMNVHSLLMIRLGMNHKANQLKSSLLFKLIQSENLSVSITWMMQNYWLLHSMNSLTSTNKSSSKCKKRMMIMFLAITMDKMAKERKQMREKLQIQMQISKISRNSSSSHNLKMMSHSTLMLMRSLPFSRISIREEKIELIMLNYLVIQE